MKSYIFVSTSFGNIWNITIKTPEQDFKVNNMYIIGGELLKVGNILKVEDI